MDTHVPDPNPAWPYRPELWRKVGNCHDCGAPTWVRLSALHEETMPMHSRGCLTPCRFAPNAHDRWYERVSLSPRGMDVPAEKSFP